VGSRPQGRIAQVEQGLAISVVDQGLPLCGLEDAQGDRAVGITDSARVVGQAQDQLQGCEDIAEQQGRAPFPFAAAQVVLDLACQ
jgi:hypothetical protein